MTATDPRRPIGDLKILKARISFPPLIVERLCDYRRRLSVCGMALARRIIGDSPILCPFRHIASGETQVSLPCHTAPQPA